MLLSCYLCNVASWAIRIKKFVHTCLTALTKMLNNHIIIDNVYPNQLLDEFNYKWPVPTNIIWMGTTFKEPCPIHPDDLEIVRIQPNSEINIIFTPLWQTNHPRVNLGLLITFWIIDSKAFPLNFYIIHPTPKRRSNEY